MSAPRAALVVAGLGRMGRLHAENLAGRVTSAALAGVVDAAEPLARAVGGRLGVPWTASLEAMLDDRAVDGVVVAAPTALHPELVCLAARAGKHVLCEKPLGFDADDARAAVAAAEAAEVSLQVGFQRRFDPGWTALKEALDSGELGRLHLLRCSHRNARPPEAGLGDLFADMAVHDLDSARWLGGTVAELLALPRPRDGEALAAALALRFESGALAAVDVSRDARYGFECSAELIGSRATARIGPGLGPDGLELLRDGRGETRLSGDHAERHRAAYLSELEHFGHVTVGRRAPRPTGEDAVAALELASAARRSVETCTPVTPVGAAV